MAQFKKALITEKGLNLIAKSQAGAKIQFTRIATGNGEWPEDTNFAKVEFLENEIQSIDINSITILNNDTVRVRGVLRNQDLTDGYFIREMGLFAEDPDLGEILYCIVTAVIADYFPADEQNNQLSILIDIITTVSNAESVLTVLNEDTVYATAEDLREANENIDSIYSSINILEASVEENRTKIVEEFIDPETRSAKTLYFIIEELEEIMGNLYKGRFELDGKILYPATYEDCVRDEAGMDLKRKLENIYAELSNLYTELESAADRDLLEEMQARLKRLEDAVLSNITGNPFEISLRDLDGLIVTGIWNKDKQRIEV